MRWKGHVAVLGGRIGEFRDLVWIPEAKRLLVRPTLRRDDNIKIELQEQGHSYRLDWSGSGQEDFPGCYEWGNTPPISIKCGKKILISWRSVSVSGRTLLYTGIRLQGWVNETKGKRVIQIQQSVSQKVLGPVALGEQLKVTYEGGRFTGMKPQR